MRKVCSVSGCGSFVKGRGLCNKHYFRRLRSGKLRSTLSRHELALAFVEMCLKSKTDKCLEPNFKYSEEYPSFREHGIHHKLGWLVLERTIGQRPNSTSVMRHYVCGNSRCCNPRHLCWGTEKENAADRKAHGTEPSHVGSNNPNTILNEIQVHEIRKRYKPYINNHDPSNAKLLAKEFGVSQSIISGIGKGVTWRHVK